MYDCARGGRDCDLPYSLVPSCIIPLLVKESNIKHSRNGCGCAGAEMDLVNGLHSAYCQSLLAIVRPKLEAII